MRFKLNASFDLKCLYLSRSFSLINAAATDRHREDLNLIFYLSNISFLQDSAVMTIIQHGAVSRTWRNSELSCRSKNGAFTAAHGYVDADSSASI